MLRRLLLGLVVVLAGLWLGSRYVDLHAVEADLTAAHPGRLAIASAVLLVGTVIFSERWRLIMRGQVAPVATFHASNVGNAGNILIPGRVGEPARIIVIAADGRISLSEATASVVVERMFEQVLRVILVVVVLLEAGLRIPSALVVGALVMVAAFVLLVVWLLSHQQVALERLPRWLGRVPRLTEAGVRSVVERVIENLAVVSRPRRLVAVLLWSVVTWAVYGLFQVLVAMAMPHPFVGRQLLAVVLGTLILSPPSAPTPPGLFHLSVIAPLAAAGIPVDQLTAYAIVLHALEMFWMILLGAVGLWRSGVSVRQLRTTVETEH